MKSGFKKIVACILCFTMILSLTACGNSNTDEPVETPAVEVEDNGNGVLENVTYKTVTEGMDWGPAITKVVLNVGMELDKASVTPDKFSAISSRTFPDVDYMTYEMSEPAAHEEEREITAAYVSDENGNAADNGQYVTLEMAVGPELEAGSPFWYDITVEVNRFAETSYAISTKAPLADKNGKEITIAATTKDGYTGDIRPITDEFDLTGTYKYTYDGGKREIDLTYASWFPQEGAKEASTPLIIWLHGMGEGGTDPFVAITGNKVINLATEDVQQYFGETGAAVLAPQTPTMWLDTSGTYNMAMGTSNSESFYTEALMSLIVNFVSEHPEIDPARLYIGGCSNGGFMTINMLVNYPGAFAAAYPVCEPYADAWMTEEKLKTLVDVPMWLTAAKTDPVVTIFEGEADWEPPFAYHLITDDKGNNIPINEYSNALYDRLVKAGAKDVHYSLFENVVDETGSYKNEDGTPYEYNGHWSWIRTLNNECVEEINGKETTIFEWMAGQKGKGVLPTLPLEKTVYSNPITFYLVRHGETEYNTQGIMQGWSDSPLTKNGVDLAKKLGKGLADVDFTAAYTSDSGRAVDTAKNVLAGRKVPLTKNEQLREMYFGEVDGKSSEGVYTDENMGYRFGVGFDDLGGETWEGLGMRMHAALEEAALEHREEGGNILISTHGMSILATLYALVPDAEGVMEQGEIDNCSVTILEWDNGVYTLKALNDSSYIQ